MAGAGKSLGRAIREARERRGMTQAQLSRLLAVPQNVVARLEEGGRADPRFSTVVDVAHALGVSLDTLAANAGLSAETPTASALQRQLLDAAKLAKEARVRIADLDAVLVQFEPAPRVPVEKPAKKRRRKPSPL